jgi:predicted transcriptional regulator
MQGLVFIDTGDHLNEEEKLLYDRYIKNLS